MPKTHLALLLLASLGAACATDSSDDVLLGNWGGKGLAITASPFSVTVEMPCETRGTLEEPAALETDGTFEFETTMHQFYGDFEVYASGKIVGGRFLEVSMETEYNRPGSQAFVLINGAEPDFRDYACLGAIR
jgi:hypothetical protein